MADVLTKGDVLYDGRVVDKMLTSDGGLAALTLGDPRRFRREEYWQLSEGCRIKPVKKADFWTRIPGKTFIIMASEISTVICVTHPNRRSFGTNDSECAAKTNERVPEKFTQRDRRVNCPFHGRTPRFLSAARRFQTGYSVCEW